MPSLDRGGVVPLGIRSRSHNQKYTRSAGSAWELVQGLDVTSLRAAGTRRGWQVALHIARGLHHMHSRKVMHLDLKSANILLARDGTAKVADVGLAKILTRDNTHVSMEGTFDWAAPEVRLRAPPSLHQAHASRASPCGRKPGGCPTHVGSPIHILPRWQHGCVGKGLAGHAVLRQWRLPLPSAGPRTARVCGSAACFRLCLSLQRSLCRLLFCRTRGRGCRT